VAPQDPLERAVGVMRDHAIRRVVVVDEDDKPVGVVSIGDLAKHRDRGSVLADISSAPS
jgi:CBS domain-containing protein